MRGAAQPNQWSSFRHVALLAYPANETHLTLDGVSRLRGARGGGEQLGVRAPVLHYPV